MALFKIIPPSDITVMIKVPRSMSNKFQILKTSTKDM